MGTPGVAPAHVKPWTQQEDEMLISLYPECNTRQITEQIQRTHDAVMHRLSFLRDRGLIGRKKKTLSAKEIAFLIENRRTRTARELAAEVGCTIRTVQVHLKKRGYSLRKCGGLHHLTRYSDHLVELVTELHDEQHMTFAMIAKHINHTLQIKVTTRTARFLYGRRTAADAALYELLPD
ncbi:DNA-binding protein [Escherichia coli]|nr:DNA-binding protein [Escherichia coli]EEY5893310.1 DNA-binding protein [Escherichia coli]EFB9699087.1 DNA-binding protein [Escherichia coli]EHS3806086.1 DNA-binding protein [Escherichia coli]EJW7753321.1 DNA-binding protein [Escherichia coli]